MRPPQFARLDDPQLLICETCLDTGRGISEAVGLQSKHFDPQKGAIRIEQRHCRGDVDQPKTKNSKRTLALGTLVGRFQSWITSKKITRPNDWIFFQEEGRTKPMWDSGVRKALKIVAVDAGCDFPALAYIRSGAPTSPCGRGGRKRHRSQQNRGARYGEPDRRLHCGAVEAAGRADPRYSRSRCPGAREATGEGRR